MLRKLGLVVVAAASLGAAALAPTSASAWGGGWHGGGWHGGWHRGWGGARLFVGGAADVGGFWLGGVVPGGAGPPPLGAPGGPGYLFFFVKKFCFPPGEAPPPG